MLLETPVSSSRTAGGLQSQLIINNLTPDRAVRLLLALICLYPLFNSAHQRSDYSLVNVMFAAKK